MKTVVRTSALVAGASAFLLASVQPASAQQVILKDPATLPDLSVSVSSPETTFAYQAGHLSATVTNGAPTSGVFRIGTTSNSVQANLDLTGLVPFYVQAAGGLSCRFTPGAAANTWDQIVCEGTMAWGTSAKIDVWFMPTTAWYCGHPTYTDISARYLSGSSDRSTTNNRAIARTDMVGCIN